MAGGFLRCTLPAHSWGMKRQRTECRRPSPPPSLFVSRDEEDCILGLLKLSGAPLVLRLGVPPPQAPKKLLIFPPPSSHPISFPGLMPLLPPPPPENSPPSQKKQDQRLPLPPPPPEPSQSLLSSPSTPSKADLRRYECSKCGKTFSSYQALGGHKRSHRKRRSPSAQKSRDTSRREELAMAVPSPSVTEYSPKKGRGIDLNQPAIKMD